MTRDRDIERVLDRFYAEGPAEMPDRLLLSVVDRIEHVPQRRLAIPTRFATMNSIFRLAAVAASIVAVVAGTAFVLSNQSIGPHPTASPTPTLTESLGRPPQSLQWTWFGDVIRPIAGVTPAPDRSGFKITGSSFVYYDSSGAPILASEASASSTSLQLVLTADGFGCQKGDVGRFGYSLTPRGSTLTLDAVSDECAVRSSALSGSWARVGCTENDPNDACLGGLDPGAHIATVFTPFVPPSSWVYDQGRFGYTVPDGWANTSDYATGYELSPGGKANEAIYLFSDIVPHSQAPSCPLAAEAGIGRTASAITSWLRGLPGLVTTKPVAVTVGGLNGYQLDLSVAPGWTHTCSYSGGKPIVSTLTATNPTPTGFDWNIAGSAHARYNVLDLGDGRAMLVSVEADNKAAWDALVAEATPVIASFQFMH